MDVVEVMMAKKYVVEKNMLVNTFGMLMKGV